MFEISILLTLTPARHRPAVRDSGEAGGPALSHQGRGSIFAVCKFLFIFISSFGSPPAGWRAGLCLGGSIVFIGLSIEIHHRLYQLLEKCAA